MQLDSACAQSILEPAIRHHGADDRSVELTAGAASLGDDEEKLVAIHQLSFAVHHHYPIPVAVERDAEIRAAFPHRFAQRSRRQRAEAVVDVQAVGCASDGNDFRAQLREDARCDVIRRAMGTIDDDSEALQRQVGRYRALAELDVPARCVVDSDCPAHVGGAHRLHRRVDRRLDCALDRIGQLASVLGEELDAVVGVGIVGRTDDDPRRRAQRAGQVGDCGSGHRTDQNDVHPGRGQSRPRAPIRTCGRRCACPCR